MAFWGVEVKPGKPFTHKFDHLKGRLHISMATLGFGTATAKSILQCNVGSRSPVYLCSLYPGSTESLQLNLELEEVDDVIFSVIGPCSIHLCGYYLATARSSNLNEDSESYGEDIVDTETERSDYSEEDEYEDSFIDDDGDPEIFPPSSVSIEEEASRDNRPKGRESRYRRLRKKYQTIESDDDGCFEENKIVNDSMHDQAKEIDNKDSLPSSSLSKNKASGRILDLEMDDSGDRGAGDAINKNGEEGGNNIIGTNLKTDNVLADSQINGEAELSYHLVDPCTVLDVGNIKKLKKKKKGEEKEACGQFIELDNTMQDEPIIDKMTQDLQARSEQHQEHVNDKETETIDESKMLPSSEVGHGQGEKPKKKRKERSKEGAYLAGNGAYHSNLANLPQRNEYNRQHIINKDFGISNNVALLSAETDPEKSRTKRKKKEQVHKGSHFEGENAYHEDIIKENKAHKDEVESDYVIHKFPDGKEQNQKLTNEKKVDNGAHDFPDGNLSEDRKVKKRKKKSRRQGNEEVVNSEKPQLSVEKNSVVVKEDGNKRVDANPSQVRTLLNGLVIQELKTGTNDGKVAASGRKISIHYIGKLKENGEIFESNAGQAPFKFRLGKGEVIKGWDVGLEGMRVGEKRRLIIPPSMASKSEEHSANIPPNAWLVYDFELVKVH